VVFVSYSRKDESLVLPLTRLLRASGQKVFLDQQDLEYGGDWKSQLARTISQAERLLLFWSKSSESSPFVAEEWRLGVATPGCSIVPVLLDRTPLPPELQRFHGTADLAPLFRTLRHMRLMRGVLWLSWAVVALGSAVAIALVLVFLRVKSVPVPVGPGRPGPVDALDPILLPRLAELAVWLMIPVIALFLLHQVSLRRTRKLYQRIAGRLAV
jgi:hypothetical protein